MKMKTCKNSVSQYTVLCQKSGAARSVAPIAQWIERCPPEAKTRVRVAVGACHSSSFTFL